MRLVTTNTSISSGSPGDHAVHLAKLLRIGAEVLETLSGPDSPPGVAEEELATLAAELSGLARRLNTVGHRLDRRACWKH